MSGRSPFAQLTPGSKRALYVLGLLSTAKALTLVVLAQAVATGVVSAIEGGAIWRTSILWGAGAALARALIVWATQVVAARAALGAKEELRGDLARRVLARGGRDIPQGIGAVTTLATRGLDELDGWFTQYLPALVSAMTIPLLIGARILWADWVSALIIVLTIPLVPIFMILIGTHTQERVTEAADSLARLSDHLVELGRGLPVLVGLGRAMEQTKALRDVSKRYRTKTMATLRVAFLSSLALELIATISVAVVAVFIGVRLVNGQMGLEIGLLVLMLAPECYLPFREVGTAHHASEDGLEALNRARRMIQSPGARSPIIEREGESPARVVVERLTVHYAGRADAAVSELSFTAAPGEIVALSGASGAGKSSVLAVLAGLLGDTTHTTREVSGSAIDAGVRVEGIITGIYRERLAWVSQHPVTYAETVREEIVLACDPDRQDDVQQILERVAVDHLADRHPGELSPGELRRVAFGRALARVNAGATLLLLDEPTAHLDGQTADRIEYLIRALRGRVTIIMVTHDPRLRAVADLVVPVGAGPVADTRSASTGEDAGETRFDSERGLSPSGMGRDHALSVADTRSANTGDGAMQIPFARDRSSYGRSARDGNDCDGHARSTREIGATLAAVAEPWRPRFLLAIVFGVLAAISAVALTAVSGWLIVRASQQPPILYLLVAIVGVRFFGIGRALFRYGERLWLHDAIFASLTDLRVRVWQSMAAQGVAGRRLLRGEETLDHLIGDVDRARDLVPRVVLPPIIGIMTAVASIVALGLVLPESIGIMIGCSVIALVAAPLAALWADRAASEGEVVIRSQVLRRYAAMFGAAADLRVNGLDRQELASIGALDARASAVARRSAWALGLGSGIVTFACCLASIGMLWIAAPAVASGTLPAAMVAVLVLTPLALIDPFLGTAEAVQQWPALRVVLARFGEGSVHIVPSERLARSEVGPDGGGSREDAQGMSRGRDIGLRPIGNPQGVALREERAKQRVHPSSSRTGRPFSPSSRPERSGVERALACPRDDIQAAWNGERRHKIGQHGGRGNGEQHARIEELAFEGLAAGWPGRMEVVFTGLSASVRRGQWLAITGPSGSGKSTLLAVILGFLRPIEGTYRLNGVDMAAVPADRIRRRIAWCPQESHLFDSSLRANLLLARSRADAPTEAEMRTALWRVGLESLLDDLPRGLETRIGAQGSFLSGGQRQRVAIARTLLTNADVLLIDEPTAHLDRETADALMADLRRGLGDKIVVMVTHEPADIADTDVRLDLGPGVPAPRTLDVSAPVATPSQAAPGRARSAPRRAGTSVVAWEPRARASTPARRRSSPVSR